MAESFGDEAANRSVALDSPMVDEEKSEDTEEQEDISNVKIGLNRSESCGSILQGTNGMGKIKNLSRRVSFPSDDKLISGYNEPRNPWEHAHETTTEELIQAYTQSCQTWNVRPITKLLVQLQEIKDFTVRANSLTLKGERLESRVVETLETIFKRVQFITIDLEATNLDEDAAAALFDMIEYYESAVNVLVGFNKNLGNRGWQAAAHMMRKMSCLRLFDGHSVPLSIQASPFVGRALRLSNTLVTLHLENAMLSGRPVLLIVAALRMNITLRELFLADNRLSPLDALQLANLLKFNRILQLLDLRNNPIQDLGLGHLCAGLMAQSGSAGLNGATGGLQTLVLWNNQISHESMPKLAMALRYTVSLSTLNLGQNVLGDDGILRLKEGLLQNHSLIRLGLVGTKLTDEGAVAIAEYLAESPRIIRLDLRNNDIKVAGLMALSLAFKINHSLLRLDIDKPNKKDAMKELAAKQESLLNDLVSYSQRNKQLAWEKVQALQQRQEEARLAQMREDNGLRYMDMTNSDTQTSTSPPVTTETSVNNSNNLSPVAQSRKEEIEEPSTSKSDGPVLHSDADDSPEDSPEFLPRSSVSYHQVAPVMLSGSEMVKRAAAARLNTVQEKYEDTSSGEKLSDESLVNKMLSDAFTGAKLTLSERNQTDKTSDTNDVPDSTQKVPCNRESISESISVSDEVSNPAQHSSLETTDAKINTFADQLAAYAMSGVNGTNVVQVSSTGTKSTSTVLPIDDSNMHESQVANQPNTSAFMDTSTHDISVLEPSTSGNISNSESTIRLDTNKSIPNAEESITAISIEMDNDILTVEATDGAELLVQDTNESGESSGSCTVYTNGDTNPTDISMDTNGLLNVENSMKSTPELSEQDSGTNTGTISTKDTPVCEVTTEDTESLERAGDVLNTVQEEVTSAGTDILNGDKSMDTAEEVLQMVPNEQKYAEKQSLNVVSSACGEMYEKENESGSENDANVINGQMHEQTNIDQGDTSKIHLKEEEDQDVMIEVSHFDLSQFPSGDHCN